MRAVITRTADDVTLGASTWDTVKDAADLGARILLDPALPQVIDVAKQIAEVETGPGVGLSHVVPILKVYLEMRRRPWLPWVVGAGALLVPFGLGMLAGWAIWRR